MCRIIAEKPLSDIACEWDLICEQRQCEIDQGRDISLTSVTSANIINHLKENQIQNVLDVGCGTGYLSNEISKIAEYCKGIDISRKSIAIACQRYHRANLSFERCEISKFKTSKTFDICVSNMVFMSDPNWKESLKHIYKLLVPNGYFYCVISHPWFWAKYKGFDNYPWFVYSSEIFIENAFSISLGPQMGKATYIHRPLESYYNAITDAGFSIDLLEELKPVKITPVEYSYTTPRFLLFRCKKGE